MAPLGAFRPRSSLCAICFMLTLPLPALAAWPNSLSQPMTLVGLSGTQVAGAIAADGSGGFFAVWADLRTGNVEEFAQRYDAQGNALWTAGGIAVATGAVVRGIPAVVADGTGGMVMSWAEAFPTIGIRAQRLNASGTPLWTAPGIRVATQTSDITDYRMSSDGAGGAQFAWEYNFTLTDHDVFAQHLTSTGTQQLGSGGLGICTLGSRQDMVVSAPDGAGGQWIVWRDNRSVVSDIYVQRVNAAGVIQLTSGGSNPETFVPGDVQGLVAVPDGFGGVHAAFSLNAYGDADIELMHVYPDGSSATTTASVYAPNDQLAPTLAADPNGGVFIAWTDPRTDLRKDIYGTHVTNYGTVSPGWDPSGSPIATGLDVYQDTPILTGDGQGGAIVVWREGGPSFKQLIATRLREDGARPPGWIAGGNPIMTRLVSNSGQLLAPTGTGGAFCVWTSDNGGDANVVAQRIDAFGQIGSPEPHIVKVRDVPNDQGGSVRLTWDASPLDTGLHSELQGYQVWRQVPASTALAALKAGSARLLRSGEAPVFSAAARTFRTTREAAAAIYWEYAGGVPAQQFTGYSLTAATTSDSVGASNPRTTFMVQAVGNFYSPGPVSPSTWWDSAPDSGYSVDNLPPSLPAAFSASWSSAKTELHWNANNESDLAGYRLYRGASASFVPGPSNLIATPVQTWYDDLGAPPSYYQLCAVDIHGNESPCALVMPSGTTDAPDDLPTRLAFAVTTANPARGSVAMRVDLPQVATVDVSVLDVSGRRVNRLEHGTLGAGRWPFVWKGAHDDGRSAAPGLYYLRLQAAGRTWTQRVVLLR